MRKRLPMLVAAVLAMLLMVPATYAVLRGYDVMFKSEPNPATIVWSTRIAMFWRIGIGTYLAGMVAPAAYVAARSNARRTFRTLYVLVFVVAALIGVQGVVLP